MPFGVLRKGGHRREDDGRGWLAARIPGGATGRTLAFNSPGTGQQDSGRPGEHAGMGSKKAGGGVCPQYGACWGLQGRGARAPPAAGVKGHRVHHPSGRSPHPHSSAETSVSRAPPPGQDQCSDSISTCISTSCLCFAVRCVPVSVSPWSLPTGTHLGPVIQPANSSEFPGYGQFKITVKS